MAIPRLDPVFSRGCIVAGRGWVGASARAGAQAEPAIELLRIPALPGAALPGDADIIILPGSKATIADLAALRAVGFDIDIAAHRRRGGMILGMCGGYQMLGRVIRDPGGIEGPAGEVQGVGLLDVETVLCGDKRLESVNGRTLDGIPVTGYEMHMGVTSGPDCKLPFAQLDDGSPEGAMSIDTHVVGTYMHGLFTDDRQRSAWLARFTAGPIEVEYETLITHTLEQLAALLAMNIDLDRLLKLAR